MSTAATATPKRKKTTRVLYLPFHPLWILLDIAVKAGVAWFAWRGLISNGQAWAAVAGTSVAIFFWVAVRLGGLEERFNRAAAKRVTTDLHPRSNGFEDRLTFFVATHHLLCFLVITNGWHWAARLVAGILMVLPAALYAFVLSAASVKSIQPVSDWDLRQDAVPGSEALPDMVAVDHNDLAILRLETEMQSMVRKVDAFTLEGALIGALAFSAFVSIVASDHVEIEALRRAYTDLINLGQCALKLDPACAVPPLEDLSYKNQVLPVVALQTLISSLLFVCVIVARLRFTSLLAPLEYFVRLAAALNHKEEHFKDLQIAGEGDTSAIAQRIKDLETDIDAALDHGRMALHVITPVIVHMAISRHLGVLAFMTALVTSALWISPYLAIIFLLLCSVAYLYPQLDEWLRRATRRNRFFSELTGKLIDLAKGRR